MRSELPPSVPSLGDVLAAGMWFVNVEIKGDAAEAGHDPSGSLAHDVVTEIAARGAEGRVLVSSFDWATVCRVRRAGPGLATAWLVGTGTPGRPHEWCARAAGAGVGALNPEDALVDADLVASAHGAGLAVNVWTVDDPHRIRALAQFGVDAVITNDPAAAIAALRER
ncbi:MAG: glycerophosphodiester phosphodiesterase [Acidimicrobiales bacterium]